MKSNDATQSKTAHCAELTAWQMVQNKMLSLLMANSNRGIAKSSWQSRIDRCRLQQAHLCIIVVVWTAEGEPRCPASQTVQCKRVAGLLNRPHRHQRKALSSINENLHNGCTRHSGAPSRHQCLVEQSHYLSLSGPGGNATNEDAARMPGRLHSGTPRSKVARAQNQRHTRGVAGCHTGASERPP
jgi:hypothetical protein